MRVNSWKEAHELMSKKVGKLSINITINSYGILVAIVTVPLVIWYI